MSNGPRLMRPVPRSWSSIIIAISLIGAAVCGIIALLLSTPTSVRAAVLETVMRSMGA